MPHRVVLGVTAIYPWFRIHDDRTTGVVLLAVNLGVCVTLPELIRTA